jgi:hypothetical protein
MATKQKSKRSSSNVTAKKNRGDVMRAAMRESAARRKKAGKKAGKRGEPKNATFTATLKAWSHGVEPDVEALAKRFPWIAASSFRGWIAGWWGVEPMHAKLGAWYGVPGRGDVKIANAKLLVAARKKMQA